VTGGVATAGGCGFEVAAAGVLGSDLKVAQPTGSKQQMHSSALIGNGVID
jgi:hypothetical protein